MSHVLYRLGRLAARRPWTVIGAWVAVAAFVIGAAAGFGRELEDSFDVPGLDSQRAAELLETTQTDRAGVTAQVVLTPLDDGVSFVESAGARAAAADVQAGLAELPNVLAVSDAAGAIEAGPEGASGNSVVSRDGRVATIRVQYPVADQLSIDDLDRLEKLVATKRGSTPLQIEAGGDLFFVFAEPETGAGELIGLVAAAIILLLAFGSFIAMGLPIGMAVFGLALGFSSLSLVTYLVEIPSWAPVIGSMVGLGVGIDYALFLVTRHREFLADGLTVEDSVGRAVATAGQAVIFAGGTVMIAILGLAVAGIPFITSGGIGVSLLVLIMVLASVTLLPAFLGLAGHRINRRGIRRRPSPATGAVGPGWVRWGRHVSRNATAYVVGAALLLLAAAAPALSLRLGFPDEGSLPETRTERRAYDLVADGFGPGTNGPLVIAIDVSNDVGVVGPLAAAVAADPGMASVLPPEIDVRAGVATLTAFPATAPQDDATYDTIKRLRADVFPDVLAGSAARAHIGGHTATWADLGQRVSDRLPLFVGAVVLLSFLLLILVFRSVAVALKAAVLNLLSTAASFGVLVTVFQWGWGMDLIGLGSTIPVIPFIPMFMFAILFGLSMDYEVFLLSRVREHFLRTGDNGTAVIHGIASTARVITSAALIMIAVFLGFVLSDDPVTKMMGFGLATAIFVDATIVRLVLVPATMTLLGNANWWLPAWLDRLLPTIDVAEMPALEPAVTTVNDPSRSGVLEGSRS